MDVRKDIFVRGKRCWRNPVLLGCPQTHKTHNRKCTYKFVDEQDDAGGVAAGGIEDSVDVEQRIPPVVVVVDGRLHPRVAKENVLPLLRVASGKPVTLPVYTWIG